MTFKQETNNNSMPARTRFAAFLKHRWIVLVVVCLLVVGAYTGNWVTTEGNEKKDVIMKIIVLLFCCLILGVNAYAGESGNHVIKKLHLGGEGG